MPADSTAAEVPPGSEQLPGAARTGAVAAGFAMRGKDNSEGRASSPDATEAVEAGERAAHAHADADFALARAARNGSDSAVVTEKHRSDRAWGRDVGYGSTGGSAGGSDSNSISSSMDAQPKDRAAQAGAPERRGGRACLIPSPTVPQLHSCYRRSIARDLDSSDEERSAQQSFSPSHCSGQFFLLQTSIVYYLSRLSR